MLGVPRSRLQVGTLLVGLVIAQTPFAHGDSASRVDGNDTPGRFDIKVIRGGHTADGTISQSLATYSPWKKRLLRDFSKEFLLEFRFLGRRRTLYVKIARDKSLYGELENARGEVVGYAKTFKSDRRTIQVSFPARLLAPNLDIYRWRAMSTFHDERSRSCGVQGDVVLLCTDLAPSTGWMTHRT